MILLYCPPLFCDNAAWGAYNKTSCDGIKDLGFKPTHIVATVIGDSIFIGNDCHFSFFKIISHMYRSSKHCHFVLFKLRNNSKNI